jgi:hypothetical protein
MYILLLVLCNRHSKPENIEPPSATNHVRRRRRLSTRLRVKLLAFLWMAQGKQARKDQRWCACENCMDRYGEPKLFHRKTVIEHTKKMAASRATTGHKNSTDNMRDLLEQLNSNSTHASYILYVYFPLVVILLPD